MKNSPRMPPNADVRSIRIAVDSEIPHDHAANAAKPTAPIAMANLTPCARTYCDLEGFTTDRLRNIQWQTAAVNQFRQAASTVSLVAMCGTR